MAALTAVVLPATAFAQLSGTFVQGFVYDTTNGNAAVPNANVFVKCNSTTLPATTNASGKYAVTFDVSDCNDGDALSVSANKDDLQGTNTGTVNEVTTNINVGVVNVFVSQVPEFGLVTGAMALLTSGGSFLAFRRMKAKA